jgi:hypothetical protein
MYMQASSESFACRRSDVTSMLMVSVLFVVVMMPQRVAKIRSF